MTSVNSLFVCAKSDVTLERVRELVSQNLPESHTLEYKEDYTPRLLRAVAAMANSYGGLILVGVRDEPGIERVVGVPETTIARIVSGCQSTFEPPWEPEIIPVSISSNSNLFVLVVRIDPAQAPRPILINGAAPIRLQGQSGIADRDRLAQLFAESPNSVHRLTRLVQMPNQQLDPYGVPTADFILRSGLVIPVGESAIWRAQSERGVSALAAALNESQLNYVLGHWISDLGIEALNPFHRNGFNRAQRVRLVWQAAGPGLASQKPIEAIAELQMIGANREATTALQFTLDVVVSIRSFLATVHSDSALAPIWTLSLLDLYKTIDAIISTLIDPEIVRTLADLAGVDPVVVPPPANLHFVTSSDVKELLTLYKLTPVPDAGVSRGANLYADPALDFQDQLERQEQLDDWLNQIALDAGLTGMESLLTEYHEAH